MITKNSFRCSRKRLAFFSLSVYLAEHPQKAFVCFKSTHYAVAPIYSFETMAGTYRVTIRAFQHLIFKSAVRATIASSLFEAFHIVYALDWVCVVCTILHLSISQLRCKSSAFILYVQIFVGVCPFLLF